MNQTIKTNITSIVFAIFCLAWYFFLPFELTIEVFIGAIIFLLILPILYIKIILHKNYRDIGFLPMTVDLRDGFYMVSAVVLGGLLSFVVVALGWGVEAYLDVLSEVILDKFNVFVIYELFFTTSTLFLFTFFAWGFVYSIKCQNKIYNYIAAFVAFFILLIESYSSAWIILPILVPVFFIPKIRDNKNIFYLFIIFFTIALILDTLIVKKFS